MGIIDPYIQQYHEEVKPHIVGSAREARWYAEQILHRLTCIHRELTIDRDPGEIMATNFVVPASGASTHLFQVPAGEEWVLECFTIDGSLAISPGVRLTADGSLRLFHYPPWGLPITPVRFRGPCDIAVEGVAGANSFPGYIQTRRLAKRARPTQSGGQVETGLDVVDALREHDPLHSGVGVG